MEKEGEESTIQAFPTRYDLQIISGGDEIIFWDNNLKMVSKMKGNDRYSILLDLNNGRMAATKGNGEIDIINYYSREIEFTLKGHKKDIVAICAIDTENIGEHIIATAANDLTIRVWNILNHECLHVIDETGDISTIAYDPRREYLLYSIVGAVVIRNYKTLEIIRKIDHGNRVNIYQLLQITDEIFVSICRSAQLSLKFWNIENGKNIQSTTLNNSDGFACGALLDKDTLLLGEADTGRVLTFDLKTYNFTNVYYQIHQADKEKDITQIYILNKTEIITCSEDSTVKLFNIKTIQSKSILNEHNDVVNSILPVLFPLNVKYENISHIPKEYIIQIGEYSCSVGELLLHRIASTLRFNIHQRLKNIIQIEYMDDNISFNHVFKPFIDNKLVISEDNLTETIILGKYFPKIKIKYERFIKQHKESLIELFAINKANAQLWNDIFTDQDPESNHYLLMNIYIYIFRYYDEVS